MTGKASGAGVSSGGGQPAASLLRFEPPRVYRYTAKAGRASTAASGSRASTGTNPTATAVQQATEKSGKATLLGRIHAFARRLDVDPALSEAIARAESGLDPTARSPDGQTEGIFQIKRMTAAAMRQRLAKDPARLPLSDEVTLGIGYLRYLDRLFATRSVLDPASHTTTPVSNDHQRRRFTIAAYNAGEGRVAAAQREAISTGADPQRFEEVRPFLPQVTQRYVDRVLAFTAAAASGPENPTVNAAGR